ncbi:MAG: hypothetical protein WD989_02140 [Candidatus Paceibacterota bacterium]
MYQPANQVEEIFHRVVNESYRPLIKSLKDNPKTKITLNINAVLSEQIFDSGYRDLIDDIIFVAQRGQIEFTGSAKYHALLPFLEDDEIERQIKLNFETNRKIFGEVYAPKGFFPPEMGYAPSLAPILKKLGYEWIVIDEIAMNGRVNQVDGNHIYQIKNIGLNVFFRERLISNLIMSALVRRKEDINIKEYDFYKKDYIVTGMDAETFGHHRPGLQTLLTELMTSDDFNHVFFSELPQKIQKTMEVEPIISTWASTEEDIEKGEQFLTWKDSKNTLHDLQWELQRLAIKAVKTCSGTDEETLSARIQLDKALASDHFFWASAKPWWSLEVIEAGAWALFDTVKNLPGCNLKISERAEKLYHSIIALSFEWQRTGYIRNVYKQYKETSKIPFKDRTIEKGEPWVYDAFIKLMRQVMAEAAKKENFEEAILWRDAIWKMETKNDIYDAIHAVDLLREKVTNEQILDMIGVFRKEYEHLSSGQPESRK